MFGKLFKKKEKIKEPTEPYIYMDQLVLNWSPDSEGWMSPLRDLHADAEIYIGPKEDVDKPSNASCDQILTVKNNINELNNKALEYLLIQSSDFISSTYKHSVDKCSFKPKGVQIFEHEGTPDEYSLIYDPIFDSGAIWSVRMKVNNPVDWGFDD